MAVLRTAFVRHVRALWWSGWSALVLTGAVIAARMTDPAPYDLVAFSRAGRHVLSGQLAGVYASDWLQAGPFELIASFLVLPQRLPPDFATLSATAPDALLVGQRMVAAAVLVGAAPFLARWLRRSCDLPASRAAELAAGLACLACQVPVQLLAAGHLSQPAICLLWVGAAVAARRGNLTVAAVLVGVSAGWEPWGLLGAPILLSDRRWRRVLPATLVLVGVAVACYLPFVLTGPFRLFEHAWPVNPFTLAHLVRPEAVRFDWSLRVVQSLVAVAVAAGAVRLSRRLPDLVWVAPAAIVLGRLLLDPLVLDSYWQPVAVLVVIGCGLMTGRGRAARTGAIVVLGLFATYPAIATAFQVTVPAAAGALTVGLPLVVLLGAVSIMAAEPAPNLVGTRPSGRPTGIVGPGLA